MTLKLMTGVALAAALIATGAQAATITNNEAAPQTIKVYSGDQQKTFTIAPADTVDIDDVLCPESCVLALQNGDEFEFAQTDELILEEGAVFSNPPLQGAAEPEQTQRQQQ